MIKRIMLLVAVAASTLFMTSGPALAQGCEDFGDAISNFAQRNQGQSVAIDEFGNLNPPFGGANQSIHGGQALLCD